MSFTARVKAPSHSLTADANAYMSKPMRLSELLAMVNTLL